MHTQIYRLGTTKIKNKKLTFNKYKNKNVTTFNKSEHNYWGTSSPAQLYDTSQKATFGKNIEGPLAYVIQDDLELLSGGNFKVYHGTTRVIDITKDQ